MQAWKANGAMLCMMLAAMGWGTAAMADGKPDGLALLKKYPDFATINEFIDLRSDTAVRISFTLCPYSAGTCDRFDAGWDDASAAADYVYLFAVFRGYYPSPDPMAGTGEKSRAAGLLQEAQDKGCGKALLDYYAAKTDCADAQDMVGCVLTSLNHVPPEDDDDGEDSVGEYMTRRYFVERHRSGGVSVLEVDADGVSHPFGE